MTNKPDFEKEALRLINKDELTWWDIKQALEIHWEKGYRYAVANDWWQTQEKDIHQCVHGVDWRGVYPCVYCEFGIKK